MRKGMAVKGELSFRSDAVKKLVHNEKLRLITGVLCFHPGKFYPEAGIRTDPVQALPLQL